LKVRTLGGAIVMGIAGLAVPSCNAILGLDPVSKEPPDAGGAGGGTAAGGAGGGGSGGIVLGGGGGSGGVAGHGAGGVTGSGGATGRAGAPGSGGGMAGSGSGGAAGAGGAPCGGELIRNGNFDLGDFVWNSVPTGDMLVVRQDSPTLGAAGPVTAQSGAFIVHLGGPKSFLVDWVNQNVTIPANAIELTASGYVMIRTDELTSSGPVDVARVQLGGDSGYLEMHFGVFSNLDATSTWTPFTFTMNVTSLAGTDNVFELYARLDDTIETDFLFDTLSLRVTGCR
jgi:hypothetical protein